MNQQEKWRFRDKLLLSWGNASQARTFAPKTVLSLSLNVFIHLYYIELYTHLRTCFHFACSDCWFWGYVVMRSDGVSSSREYCEVFARSCRAWQGSLFFFFVAAVSCFCCQFYLACLVGEGLNLLFIYACAIRAAIWLVYDWIVFLTAWHDVVRFDSPFTWSFLNMEPMKI